MPVLGKWVTGSPLIFWAGWELENCKIRATALQVLELQDPSAPTRYLESG